MLWAINQNIDRHVQTGGGSVWMVAANHSVGLSVCRRPPTVTTTHAAIATRFSTPRRASSTSQAQPRSWTLAKLARRWA